MNVVTCYQAAKVAKVSKQIMSTRKNVNALNKNKYKYFAFDKDSGDFGVDLDHNEWKRYMTKRRSTEAFKNEQSKDTKSQSTDHQQEETVIKKHFAQALVNALRKEYNKTNSEIKIFLPVVQGEYDEIIGRN